MKFEQCPKAFFMYKNFPFLKDKLSVDKQLTFKRGHEVGALAQQLFPGGIDVSNSCSNAQAALAYTKELIAQNQEVIYEAAFMHQGFLIYVDILVHINGEYIAYEVKSSLKVSETYLKDAYLQYYVLKHVLKGFQDMFLVTLNGDYRLEGEIEPKKLFKKRGVRVKAEENLAYFAHRLQEANELLDENKIPNTPVGLHCFRPYSCDFFGTCWKDRMHDDSIFHLPMIDKNTLFEWYEMGYKNLTQLDAGMFEKSHQKNIWQAFLEKRPIVNRDSIAVFVGGVKNSMVAMDMEIWNPAIPQLQGSKPFEQIPFLVCTYDGEKQENYFATGTEQGALEFAEALIKLTENYKSVLVYDKTMEISTIEMLIKKVPAQKTPLERLCNKIHDIFEVFLGLHFYDPAFKNNFSLKTTAGVLLGEQIGYAQISSGLEAMAYYNQFLHSEEGEEKEKLKQALIQYCDADSKATFELFGYLKSIVNH